MLAASSKQGHPDFEYTQLPARDGIPHGNIKRSNRHPNNTFFTNWTSLDDKITWNIEVLANGTFEVELYYTCAEKNVGSTFLLSLGDSKLTAKITTAHRSGHPRARQKETAARRPPFRGLIWNRWDQAARLRRRKPRPARPKMAMVSKSRFATPRTIQTSPPNLRCLTFTISPYCQLKRSTMNLKNHRCHTNNLCQKL